MKISIDAIALVERANSIKDLSELLNSNMKNIEKTILSLDYEWQGKSELAYVAKILYVKKQFNILYEFLNELPLVLKTIAADYEELEQQIKMLLEG